MTILVHPDEALRQVSQEVAEDYAIEPLAQSLIQIMRQHGMAVGLSAIQIGVPRRVFIMIQDPKKRMPEIVVNPQIVKLLGEAVKQSEGCLSFPGVYEDILRHPSVMVSYKTFDLPFKGYRVVEKTLEAFPAQIFQHEYEHLDGKLLVDHLDERNQKRITGKLKKWKMKGYAY